MVLCVTDLPSSTWSSTMKTIMAPLHSSIFNFSSVLPPRLMYAPTFQPSSFQVFAAAQLQQTSTPKRSRKPTQKSSSDSTTDSDSTQNKKVLVPIAFGTEEMEAVIMVDVLRRAGAEVTVASVEQQLVVEASGGTKLVADVSISACSDKIFDLVALPGGMPGSARFRDCEILQRITSKQAENKRLYGAICAAPAVTLLPWGLIRKKKTTCHPAFFDKLPRFWAVKADIQVSGELTTSRGPGTSYQFALSLVDQLFGESVAKETGDLMLMSAADDICKKQEFNEVEWSLDHAPTVLVPIANGSEEIEVASIVDILRRAKIEVVVASIERSLQISAAQGMKIVADTLMTTAADKTFDLIILTGGKPGSEKLHKSRVLKRILLEHTAGGRMVGAMCSSPAILEKHGLLKDRKVTSHPSFIGKLNGLVDDAQVVIDGKLITSKGLSTTTDFGLAIVSKIFGHARARSVAEGLAVHYPKTI